MAKRGGYPGGMMPGNMNNLMKQAQRMQRQMEEGQKELESKEFTATAGGGAVEVTVSGKKEILKVKLTFDPNLSGRVIGLIQNARGVLLDQTVRGDRQTVTAEIPVAESLELPVEFAKMTSGRGNMATAFSHYASCPPGFTAERERIGTNPLDRAKYILEKRNALSS